MIPLLLLSSIAAWQEAPAPAQDPLTYESWIEGLSEPRGFQAYTARYQMKVRMDLLQMQAMQGQDVQRELEREGVSAEDMIMTMAFQGRWDAAGPALHRLDGSFHMEFGLMEKEGVPGPIELDLLLVSDGRTVYVEPTYRSEWMLEKLQQQSGGFHKKVFTVRTEVLGGFLDEVGRIMEKEMPGMLQGKTYTGMLAEYMNPLTWSRTCTQYADVEDFRAEDGAVRMKLSLKQEWLDAMSLDPGAQAMFGDEYHYEARFDRETGAPLSLLFKIGGDAMTMEMHVDLDLVDAFGEGHFEYEMPGDKSAFDVTPFLELARQGMREGEYGEDDLDF